MIVPIFSNYKKSSVIYLEYLYPLILICTHYLRKSRSILRKSMKYLYFMQLNFKIDLSIICEYVPISNTCRLYLLGTYSYYRSIYVPKIFSAGYTHTHNVFTDLKINNFNIACIFRCDNIYLGEFQTKISFSFCMFIFSAAAERSVSVEI